MFSANPYKSGKSIRNILNTSGNVYIYYHENAYKSWCEVWYDGKCRMTIEARTPKIMYSKCPNFICVKQTPYLCDRVMEIDPNLFMCCEQQTEKNCIIAIKNGCSSNINYVPEKFITRELSLCYVKKYKCLHKKLKQNAEIVEIAVRGGYAYGVENTDWITEDMCLDFIRHNGYVENLPDRLQTPSILFEYMVHRSGGRMDDKFLNKIRDALNK